MQEKEMIKFEDLQDGIRNTYMAKSKRLLENGLTNDPFIDIIDLAIKIYKNDLRSQNENSINKVSR